MSCVAQHPPPFFILLLLLLLAKDLEMPLSSLCRQGNQSHWIPRCGWSFKDVNKLNELLYRQHQSDMDLRHQVERKLPYRPFALDDEESDLLKQVILSDVSPFWRVVNSTSFFKITTANYEPANRPQKDKIDCLFPLYRVMELFCFIKTTDEKTKSLKIQFLCICAQNAKHTNGTTPGLGPTSHSCWIARRLSSDKV